MSNRRPELELVPGPTATVVQLPPIPPKVALALFRPTCTVPTTGRLRGQQLAVSITGHLLDVDGLVV